MNLLFDLDGTLTDPFHGITTCIQYALISLGRSAPSAENLRWSIGPPLKDTFATLLGPQGKYLADAALEKYRERFSSIGLFENTVYPDIEDALNELKSSGHRLCVATSKPTVFAKRIINHFNLAKYFCTIDGSELNGVRSNKDSLISHIIERDSLTLSETVMIGDREHDMIGACSNGIAGFGVLWGYGSKKELYAAGACLCIESPSGLRKIVEKAEL